MSRRLCLIVVGLLLATAVALPAAEPKPTEYDVKAAFLYNFARFVEWPEGARQDTLRIGILGKDNFGNAFDAVLGRARQPQPVVVQRVDQVDELGPCHILFVSDSERRHVAPTIASVAGRPILTVSDLEGFAERGGIVCFVTRQSKIRFQINPAAAERAGLRLSAKLLRLAELVEEGD